MKSITAIVLILVAGLVVSAQEKSQSDKAPAHKMVEFQMALLKRAPNWENINIKNQLALEKAQTNYVKWLIESGKAVIAGRLTDDGEIRGVYVLRAKTAEEAKAWADDSPAVKSGHLV